MSDETVSPGRDEARDGDAASTATGVAAGMAAGMAAGVASPARRSLLAMGAAAGAATLALGASPGHADVLRSLKGLLYLDPLVMNFAFEMEELESDFFGRVLRSEIYNKLAPRERNAFTLIAMEDRDHFEAIKRLRDRTGNKPATHFESSNASSSRRPGLFYYPASAFKSREALMNVALDIKETALFAYHGAVDLVDKKTLMLAAAVAGVEGRHLAVLRELNGIDPVPSPFEGALQSGVAGRRLARYGFNGGGYGMKGGSRP